MRIRDWISDVCSSDLLMLAAELFRSRRDCLHVEWRVRPRVVRRHGAINLNLAEVIVGFKQGNANRLGENGSIAALIANRIVFDHRQAMKRGGAADRKSVV